MALRKAQDLANVKVSRHQGVVASGNPLTVYIGGSQTAVPALALESAGGLAVGDRVSIDAWRSQVLVLGRATNNPTGAGGGGGGGGGSFGVGPDMTALHSNSASPTGFSWLSPLGHHNVKTYGAKGNDSADDTLAIQTALNVCAYVGGGIVWVPPGTYLLTSNLVMYSNTTLMGAGWASILKVKGGLANGFPNGQAITNSSYVASSGTNTQITVRDLQLDGNKDNVANNPAGAGYPTAFIVFGKRGAGQQLSHIRVQDCYVHDTPEFGMALYSTDHLTVTGNQLYETGRDGINFGNSRYAAIGNNVVSNAGDDHIVCNGTSAFVTISGNVCVFASSQWYPVDATFRGRGIAVRGGSDIDITGNHIYGTAASAISLHDYNASIARVNIVGNQTFAAGYLGSADMAGVFIQRATAGRTIKDVLIEGNQFGSSLSKAVRIYGATALGDIERIDIKNNQMQGDGDGGVYLESDYLRKITINGNTIDSPAGRGIYSTGTHSQDLVVTDNRVRGATGSLGHGIQLENATDVTVTGNTSSGNALAGMRLRALSGNVSIDANHLYGNTGLDFDADGSTFPAGSLHTAPIPIDCFDDATSAAATANQTYYAMVLVRRARVVTGVRYQVGTTPTGNVRCSLYSGTGDRLYNRTTDVAQGASGAIQDVPFSSVAPLTPGVYYASLTFGGAGQYQKVFASNPSGSVAVPGPPGSGATATSITPPTVPTNTPWMALY